MTPFFRANGHWVLSPTSGVSWKKLVLRDPCPYCCATPRAESGGERMTVEHIRPASLGGNGGWENIASAHIGCNGQRGSRPLLQFILFRQRMGTLRGKKGTPTRKERQRMRAAFWGLGRRTSPRASA